MNTVSWILLLLSQVFARGLNTIFIQLSKVNGVLLYSVSGMSCVVEFIKLIFSICSFLMIKLQFNQKLKHLKKTDSLDQVTDEERSLYKFELSKANAFYYLIPSFFYFINNNLYVYLMDHMDPTTNQILGNLRILSTAVLYYLIIGKQLSNTKWFSLFLLSISGVFYVFGNLRSSLDKRTASNASLDSILNEMFITRTGVILIIIQSFLSGFVAVYNEYLLKQNFKSSIHLQNIYLYVYGTIFNYITFHYNLENDKNIPVDAGLFSIFNNFNVHTWLLIVAQVFIGIATSVIMKHGSNITRLFVISSALIVNAVFAVLVFNLNLNIYFFISFLVISFAIYLYSKN